MSASQTPPGSTAGAAAGGAAGGDPSMEDILASIRRILSEDEAPAGGAKPPAPEPPGETSGDGVLVLDPAMMVPDPAHEADPLPEPPPAAVPPPSVPETTPTLVAPEAAAAAASSVSSLMRTLAQRNLQVHGGGPTIEDIVREELRPLLKAWLDANLPSLVERLVRTEIERVVGRAVP
jgi:cell pole-organizing protein PopZ